MTVLDDPVGDPAYRLFQQRFGALRRARRAESLLTVAAVVLLFVVAAGWTDFSPEKIADGIPRIGGILAELRHWMTEHEYSSIRQMRGSMSQKNVREPAAFERANYMKALHSLKYAGV